MDIFLGELIGTGLLILLGDGVVAGVLLARSKAENAGWIVITMAWGLAVFVGVIVAGPITGAHLMQTPHRRVRADNVVIWTDGELTFRLDGAADVDELVELAHQLAT